MLRALLFDFNGVLVDDEPIHQRLVERVLAEEGVEIDPDHYAVLFLGLPDRDCFRVALRDAGRAVTAASLMRLVARKAAYYQGEIRRSGYPFFAGAVELAKDAAAAGLALGVVTSALRDEVRAALDQEGLLGSFKAIVAADDVEHGKPSPEPYLKGLEELNSRPPLPDRLFHPHQVLAVEDTPRGVESASLAGLVTLGVAHTCPRLARADRLVPSLAGLSAADLQEIYAEVSSR